MSNKPLEKILVKASEGVTLKRHEITFLLNLADEKDIDLLFRTARYRRRQHFGDGIFLYGFLYFSTHCRNDCQFCLYRKSHTTLKRYRKQTSEMITAARRMANSGIHLIDMTMGEDPAYLYKDETGAFPLLDLVAAVKSQTGTPIMISPGVLSTPHLSDLSNAGAEWYACYQETHNRSLFVRLRSGQSYGKRIRAKREAKASGMLIEEGLLCGVGETACDIADSIYAMKALDADQVRVMRFVPNKGIPMARHGSFNAMRELITIAVLRLVFPDRLIPASLDVDGAVGLKSRLDAGANVVTSLVPPGNGLCGVANATLDIESARRTPKGILTILESLGLQFAPMSDYIDWIRKRRLELDGVKPACSSEAL